MRRDYFTCVFLGCIAASLFFVWLLPLYFTYGLVIPREFGTLETVAGFAFAAVVLIVIPVYAAWAKKLWITLGLAFYGIVPYLPIWFLPKITEKITTGNASVVSSLTGFLLKSIYGMVNAPFAPLSRYLGDEKASDLSLWILPVSLAVYMFFQLFRFYRDAYVAEQLDPQSVVDSTAKENTRQEDGPGRKAREAKVPEVLGTVISAPVTPKSPAKPAPSEAPAKQPQQPRVTTPPPEKREQVPQPEAANNPAVEAQAQSVRRAAPPPAEEEPEREAKMASADDGPILLGPPRGVAVQTDDTETNDNK